mgnify:FL=1
MKMKQQRQQLILFIILVAIIQFFPTQGNLIPVNIPEEHLTCVATTQKNLFIVICDQSTYFYTAVPVVSNSSLITIDLHLLTQLEGNVTKVNAEGLLFVSFSHRDLRVGKFESIGSELIYSPVTYSQIDGDLLISKVSSRENHHILINLLWKLERKQIGTKLLTRDQQFAFVEIYKLGGISNYFEIPFYLQTGLNPVEDFQLYHDNIFGHDYLILGLHNITLKIYRSYFEDATMSFEEDVNLYASFGCISRIMLVSNFVFVTCNRIAAVVGHAEKIFLKVFRVQITWMKFQLKEECSLDFSREETPFFITEKEFQIEIKQINNQIMIFVAFLTQTIKVYTMELPLEFDHNSIRCPIKETDEIHISKLTNESSFKSFTYYKNSSANQSLDGLVITLLSNESVFLPYCFSNSFLSGNYCLPCEPGTFSYGGRASKCTPCIEKSSNPVALLEFSQSYDHSLESCPFKCKDSSKFGPNCESCGEYRTRMKAELQPFSEWNTSTCSLQCTLQKQTTASGICVYPRQKKIMRDHCAQITDCYNCSLTDSCGWCGAICINIKTKSCPIASPNKPPSNGIANFQDLFWDCDGGIPACGTPKHSNSSGTVKFIGDVYRNTFCKWSIGDIKFGHPHRNHNFTVNFKLGAALTEDPAFKDNFIMQICQPDSSDAGEEQCYFEALPSQASFSRQINATQLEIAILVRTSMPKKSDILEISYRREVLSGEKVSKTYGIVLFFVFLFVGVYVGRETVHQIRTNIRNQQYLQEMAVPADAIERMNFEGDNMQESRVYIDRTMMNMLEFEQCKPNEYKQTECCICLEEFKESEKLTELICKHLFHAECFESWIANSELEVIKCPICARHLQ